MNADALRKRLDAYSEAERRANWLRDAISHLERAQSVRVALSLADVEDARTVLIPAHVALPYYRAEIERAEGILASYATAAAPLLALEA